MLYRASIWCSIIGFQGSSEACRQSVGQLAATHIKVDHCTGDYVTMFAHFLIEWSVIKEVGDGE